MHKTYILILSVLLFSSCFFKPDRKVDVVQISNRFSIDVPATYHAQNDMHDFASLQFAHEVKPIYLIGFTEPKNELRKLKLRFSLEDYSHFATENLGDAFSYTYISDTLSSKINGTSCFITYMDVLNCQGSKENDIAYEIAIFEGKEYYSQLIAWAPASDKEELHSEMASMIGTFKDISVPDDKDPDPAYMGNPAGSKDLTSF